MQFFETDRPYRIAKEITNGHELSRDLVAHVFLIMRGKEHIKNIAGYFAGCCYREFNNYNSEFNRTYRPYYTCEINDEITKDHTVEWIESKYKKFLNDYIEKQPSGESSAEWYKRQIAKFVLQGMTQKEIEKKYNINQSHVSQTLKQFREDVRNYYIKCCGSEDINNL